jgi:hypothetical protein
LPQNVGPRAREQQEPIGLTLYASEAPMDESGYMSQLNAAHAKNLRRSRHIVRTLTVWEDDTRVSAVGLDPPSLNDCDDPALIREMSRIREDDR